MKSITRDKERSFMKIKGPTYQEDITTLNMCALKNKVSKYTKKEINR